MEQLKINAPSGQLELVSLRDFLKAIPRIPTLVADWETHIETAVLTRPPQITMSQRLSSQDPYSRVKVKMDEWLSLDDVKSQILAQCELLQKDLSLEEAIEETVVDVMTNYSQHPTNIVNIDPGLYLLADPENLAMFLANEKRGVYVRTPLKVRLFKIPDERTPEDIFRDLCKIAR